MSWTVAPALVRLRDQLNRQYPNRNKRSDGTIGDAAHSSTVSQHNPNKLGVVTAMDITHSPESGLDCQKLMEALKPDFRVWYLIFNRMIWEDGVLSPYYGSNPHTSHLHISTEQDPATYNDNRDWSLMTKLVEKVKAVLPSLNRGKTVHLPDSVRTWAAYEVGSGYRKGTKDQVGTLLPSQFGGLTYNVVEDKGNVVVIDTASYGRVAIWVAGTEAVFGRGVAVQPTQASLRGTVTFPASVSSWAVYKVGSGYRKGTSDQVGTLAPSKFNGLTYPILERRNNVVVIQTQDFGKVAAWVTGTEAIVR